MARFTPSDWQQPSLLDRLTDDRPDQRTGSPRVLTRRGLEERVRSELSHLLNASSLESTSLLSELPHVRATGLNYGIRDLTGCTRSGVSPAEIEQRIRSAILRFEPRLIARTLSVTCSSSARRAGRTSIELRIEAELACRPVPEHLRFSTVLNLEDGEATIKLDARN
jgi:type VI secretion system protein ImpF